MGFKLSDSVLAIKTGLVAALAFLIGAALAHATSRPDNVIGGLWCVMAGIVVLQSNIGGTYKAAWNRLLGVAVGTACGGVFIQILGSTPLSFCLGAALTVLICALVGLKESLRIACLSVAVVMIVGAVKSDSNPWLFSLWRFFDSALGITIALVIAHLIPAPASRKFRDNAAHVVELLATVPHLREPRDVLNQVVELLHENREILEDSTLEALTVENKVQTWIEVQDDLETLAEDFRVIQSVESARVVNHLDAPLQDTTETLWSAISTSLTAMGQQLRKEGSGYAIEELAQAEARLDDEQKRFRESRSTREFALLDVQNYFVYFFAIRSILRNLRRLGGILA